MNKDVLSFVNIRINNDLLDEIWAFNAKELDTLDGAKLSSYALALSQYLVYFTYQKNLARAEEYKLNKYIDRTVSLIMIQNPDNKKYKTKAAAADDIITTSEPLTKAQTKLDEIKQELIYIEGMDKVISELIATIKRELTRRENELYQIRMERKN